MSICDWRSIQPVGQSREQKPDRAGIACDYEEPYVVDSLVHEFPVRVVCQFESFFMTVGRAAEHRQAHLAVFEIQTVLSV